MDNTEQTFEQRKAAAIKAAREEGIVDVVRASTDDGISIELLELATRLMKENGPDIYREISEHRKQK